MIKEHMSACKDDTALSTVALYSRAVADRVNNVTPIKPYSIGALWDRCCAAAEATTSDAIMLYAKARGITREEAKAETFHIRYGSEPRPLADYLREGFV